MIVGRLNVYKEFGRWMRNGRMYEGSRKRRKKITLEELHDKTGYGIGYLSMIERAVPHGETGGAIRPSEEFVRKISEALGLDEREGRMLAGYRETDEEYTVQEVKRIVAGMTPHQNLVATISEEGMKYAVLDIDALAEEIGKRLQQNRQSSPVEK
jgi:transcriptional regulator with XRE-family HTH domain